MLRHIPLLAPKQGGDFILSLSLCREYSPLGSQLYKWGLTSDSFLLERAEGPYHLCLLIPKAMKTEA